MVDYIIYQYLFRRSFMQHTISCKYEKDMCFEAEVAGHKIKLDASPQFGGQDYGPTPKPLLLTSLAGCTGLDVVSILNKMRVPIKYFNVVVSGELSETEPKVYTSIHITYQVDNAVPKDKVEKAVKLSQEQYCGVSAMLRKACELTYSIEYIAIPC